MPDLIRQPPMRDERGRDQDVVALGREGKAQIEIDASNYPCTLAMAAKLQTDEGRSAYRKRKWIAEPPHGGSRTCWGSGSSA